jgi:hypothetical protein
MNSKMEFVAQRAVQLYASNSTITGQELAVELNANGFLTNYGTPFSGGRGTYRLISATCDTLRIGLRGSEANSVVYAFTKANGNYGWNN